MNFIAVFLLLGVIKLLLIIDWPTLAQEKDLENKIIIGLGVCLIVSPMPINSVGFHNDAMLQHRVSVSLCVVY